MSESSKAPFLPGIDQTKSVLAAFRFAPESSQAAPNGATPR